MRGEFAAILTREFSIPSWSARDNCAMLMAARTPMRQTSRPLARELSLMVLASAAPAAACAAALAASVYDPAWQNALLLVMSATALAAGVSIAWLIARGLANALEDIAADARMLARGAPLARLETKIGEFAAIADALEAAAARLRPAEPVRVDLAEGQESWSRAVAVRYLKSAPAPMPSHAAAIADEGCDPGELLKRLAHGFAPGAAAAGIALDFDVAPGLPTVRGAAQDLESALFGLLDAALTVTARGGRISLSARAAAEGAVRIVLAAACPAPADARGIENAGGRVELSCGAALAASLARARALVAASGGELTPGAGMITILLAPAAQVRRAA